MEEAVREVRMLEKRVISSKTATNKAAQSLIETLEAHIVDIDASRVEFTTERVDLEKDLVEVNFAIEEAAALRKGENEYITQVQQ